MTNYPSLKPSNLSRSSIKQLASEVAKHFNYKVGGDLAPIVESLGGRIAYVDLWSLESYASIDIKSQGEFVITLANHVDHLRNRFNVCHELGHYFLHFALGTPVQVARYGSGQADTEANWFAAAFLAPDEEFKSSFKEMNGNKLLLVETFKIPMQTVNAMKAHLRL